MKTRAFLVFVWIMVVTAAGLAVFNAYSQQPKPAETVTLKGELVDMYCYLDGGLRGADHKACATECAKAGNPIGLLTEKGDLYLLMSADKMKPINGSLADKMAQTVSVTGKVVKKGGVQTLFVSEVK